MNCSADREQRSPALMSRCNLQSITKFNEEDFNSSVYVPRGNIKHGTEH